MVNLILNIKNFSVYCITYFYKFFIVKFNNILKLLNFFIFCNIFYLFFDISEHIFFLNEYFFRVVCLFVIIYLLTFCREKSVIKLVFFSFFVFYYFTFFFRLIFYFYSYYDSFQSFLYSLLLNNSCNETLFFKSNVGYVFVEMYMYILLVFFIFLYISKVKGWSYDYILSCFFLYLGCCLLLYSEHYLTFFLSLEIISFSTYILIGFNVFNLYSSEASLKYFILSAISSSFFLIGMILIYYSSGSLFFNSFDFLQNNLDENVFNVYKYTFYINKLYFGHVLILLVLFFKIGLAPFHFWVADIYEGSSFISMGILMFIAKTSYFFSLIKVYNVFIFYNKDFYTNLLLLFSFFSIILGVFGALRQRKLKRFLAYTSIVNMGYIVLLLSFNFYCTIFYFYVYTFISFIFFFYILLKVHTVSYSLIYLADLNKFNINNILLIFFFIFAAVPPSPLFFFKYYIFLNLFNNGYFFLLGSLVCASLLSLFYYLRLIQFIFYRQEFVKD